MRKGLFLCALLATAMVGGTALAERTESDSHSSRGQNIKEQVLQKQREGFTRTRPQATRTDRNTSHLRNQRVRPHGEVYGDQATRSTSKARMSSSGQNMSATGKVNTPSEIRKMRQMINPMYGAYRTSQADSGTDSYGGQSMVPNGKSSTATGSKNMSATGRVNTPAEIAKAMHMINPMYGAYRTAASDQACESYGGRSMTPAGYHNKNQASSEVTRHVHFKNDKGEVITTTHGNTATAMKNRKLKAEIMGMMKAKMAEKAKISGR